MARRGQQITLGDRLAERIAIGVLMKVFTPELVDRVVDRIGVREQRKRALPSQLVVYYVLAMVLFFHSSYTEVWDKLAAGLEWTGWCRPRAPRGARPTAAAITYARERLGWHVMEALLAETAGTPTGPEQQSSFVSGMRPVTVDGVCFSLPETPENAAEFGYPGSAGASGPVLQVRVVAAGECVTGAVLAAELSPVTTEEETSIRRLLARLSPGDLLLGDSSFLSHGVLRDALAARMHVLWRARSEVRFPVLEVLADGTYRSLIADTEATREMRNTGTGSMDIPGIAVRILQYTVTGAEASRAPEPVALFTDILDPQVLGMEQAAAAYASRWQLESCFDELEISVPGGSAVVLRSRSPQLVRQEVYAMLCCYQAIRTLITHAAGKAAINPTGQFRR